jgi:hypothetical protein
MTNSFTSKLRQAGLILTIATTVSVFTSHQSFAFSAEVRQMCKADAFRLCYDDIPNVPKTTACMVRHSSELSAGCRAAVERDPSAQSSKTAATGR